MKFGVVGVIAFFIDYGLLIFLTEVFHIDYLISATLSFSVSVVFNYLASMRYVFTHKEGMSRHREFIIFVILSIIGLIINDVMMFLGTSVLAIDYRITKLVATFVVMVWNFVTRKIFLDAGNEVQEAREALRQDIDQLEDSLRYNKDQGFLALGRRASRMYSPVYKKHA